MLTLRRNKRFLGEKVPLVCTVKTSCSDRFHHGIFLRAGSQNQFGDNCTGKPNNEETADGPQTNVLC